MENISAAVSMSVASEAANIHSCSRSPPTPIGCSTLTSGPVTKLNESGGTGMDVTEQRQAQAALETAFEEIKRLKDRLQDENLALREEIDQAFMFEEIIGASLALKSVLSHVSKVAPTDSTVLISGETGTERN